MTSKRVPIRQVDFDPDKDAINQKKHGISLARAADYEIEIQIEDTRRNYGETRWRSYGKIDGVLYALAFTIRNERIRAISLRRADFKELRRYVAQ
jgi:uncharacterized DUF497 family protein